MTKIAMIGGGAAGTLTFYHLVNSLPLGSKVKIYLFDKKGEFGKGGLAFGNSAQKEYITNTPLWQHEGLEEFIKANKHPLAPEGFIYRSVIGKYLEYQFGKILAVAKEKNIEVVTIDKLAESYENGALTDEDGNEYQLDKIVIASGNYCATPFDDIKGVIRPYKDDLSEIVDTHQVLVIGMGLTAIDMISSLASRQIKSHVLSTTNKFPAAKSLIHETPEAKLAYKLTLSNLKKLKEVNLKTISRLYYQDFCEKRSRGISKLHSRTLTIRSLRRDLNEIWLMLSDSDRLKFSNKFFKTWNHHRHTIPSHVHTKLESLESQGLIEKLNCKIKEIIFQKAKNNYLVKTNKKDFIFDKIIAATGPAPLKNPFIVRLIRDNNLELDQLNKIKLNQAGQSSKDNIYFIGTIAANAKRLESIAYYDINIDAKRLVENLNLS